MHLAVLHLNEVGNKRNVCLPTFFAHESGKLRSHLPVDTVSTHKNVVFNRYQRKLALPWKVSLKKHPGHRHKTISKNFGASFIPMNFAYLT